MKILLLISAVFWLGLGLWLIIEAQKRKVKKDYLLTATLVAVALFIGLHAFGVVNIQWLVGLLLAAQATLGLIQLYELPSRKYPVLVAAGSLIVVAAAAWWLFVVYRWLSLLFAMVVVVLLIGLFLFCWWLSRDR